MTGLDFGLFGLYMIVVLGVGFYHFLRNQNTDDYYVGGRSMTATHVGMSVVATDVGGGFSIGLGGLGFIMGLSGSWLLFTGLIGAWLSAVLIIPRIRTLDSAKQMRTYPDFLRARYNEPVAMLAALISGIGYLGFTGSQIKAGATLAANTILPNAPAGLDPIIFATLVIAAITIVYTVLGGMKAVVYTDSIQWVVLLIGLIGFAVPAAIYEMGGLGALREHLAPSFLSLFSVHPIEFINWMITIIPIWLIAMTLYQRMFACKDVKEAKKAWFIAGLFEWPVMAFTGVFLGMCARVVFPEIPDSAAETGLPRLIAEVLPIGVAGVVVAAYFSAIMSTADSCLMASSGNFVNDVLERFLLKGWSDRALIRISQVATLVIGVLAVLFSIRFETVLDSILYAYGFMVSGLFVPTLGAYFWRRASSTGAFFGMLFGGTLTVCLTRFMPSPPEGASPQLDFTLWGMLLSAVVFVALSLLFPDKPKEQTLDA